MFFHIFSNILPNSNTFLVGDDFSFSLKMRTILPSKAELLKSLITLDYYLRRNMHITAFVAWISIRVFKHDRTPRDPISTSVAAAAILEKTRSSFNTVAFNFESHILTLMVALFKALPFTNTFELGEVHPSWYEIGSVAPGPRIIIRGVYINWKSLHFSKPPPAAGMLK